MSIIYLLILHFVSSFEEPDAGFFLWTIAGALLLTTIFAVITPNPEGVKQ